MKTKDVIGKRIVKVEQGLFYNRNNRRMDNDVTAFILEDGTRFWPVTIETDNEYAHDFGVSKPKRRKSKREED